MPVEFLCAKTGLKSEELLSYFASTAGKSLLGLDIPINTGVFLRKWDIKLLHPLYKGYSKCNYFVLATDWPALPSLEESV